EAMPGCANEPGIAPDAPPQVEGEQEDSATEPGSEPERPSAVRRVVPVGPENGRDPSDGTGAEPAHARVAPSDGPHGSASQAPVLGGPPPLTPPSGTEEASAPGDAPTLTRPSATLSQGERVLGAADPEARISPWIREYYTDERLAETLERDQAET